MANEEELWDTWTSRGEAAIVLDGQNDVFSAIRSQLAFLRKQGLKAESKIDRLTDRIGVEAVTVSGTTPDLGVNSANTGGTGGGARTPTPTSSQRAPVSQSPAPSSAHAYPRPMHKAGDGSNADGFDASADASADGVGVDGLEPAAPTLSVLAIPAPAPAPPPVPVPVPGVPGVSLEDFGSLAERVESLELSLRNSAKTIKQLTLVQQSAGESRTVSLLQARVEQLSLRCEESELTGSRFESHLVKINQINATLDARVATMQAAWEATEAHLQAQNSDEGLNIAASLNQLRDVVQINEHRLKNCESDIYKTRETLVSLAEAVDVFPVKHLDNIKNDIIDLYMSKASREDLYIKADAAVFGTKADIGEISRLEQLAYTLDRKIDLFGTEMNTGFGTLDARLEKRVDKIAQWCLKSLRREMKAGNWGAEEPREGTDIGKVRCLVCDQVVPQLREAEIVHRWVGKPGNYGISNCGVVELGIGENAKMGIWECENI
jgi:hypothetical protein